MKNYKYYMHTSCYIKVLTINLVVNIKNIFKKIRLINFKKFT